jgi:hypothetical protein
MISSHDENNDRGKRAFVNGSRSNVHEINDSTFNDIQLKVSAVRVINETRLMNVLCRLVLNLQAPLFILLDVAAAYRIQHQNTAVAESSLHSTSSSTTGDFIFQYVGPLIEVDTSLHADDKKVSLCPRNFHIDRNVEH